MKIWFSLFLGFTVAVSGNASDRATKALAAGSYADARMIGREDGGVEGLMAACQAGMLLGGFYESDIAAVESLHGAAKDCRSVVALESSHLNANITLAIIVGLEGKRWRKPGLAKQSRRRIEKVLADYPTMPTAHGALGGWHSEVSAAGFLARLYLGAKRKTADTYFRSAIEKGERSFAFYVEYIKFLARGKKADRAEALKIGLDILKQPSIDAVDRLMKENISKIAAALNAQDKKALKKAIASATAFNEIEKWRNTPVLDIQLPE